MIRKYYCIHAHLDLPPRENPWLGNVDPDPAASVYRDQYEHWFNECFGPNATAARVDENGRVSDLVDNYRRISFSASPDILAWIERRRPRIYERILQSDRLSRKRNRGHGNALAMAAPGLILPLASETDKRSAIGWGLADFRRRFEREAEGFWLPENAADPDTMEALVDSGVRFTLLAASQAARIRPLVPDAPWRAADALDISRPYLWRSKKHPGKSVAIFFYRRELSPEGTFSQVPPRRADADPAEIARAVREAGIRFATRLLDGFTGNESIQLSHAAFEGFWLGIRGPFGERSLRHTLERLESTEECQPLNYGAYLDRVPPPEEVELHSLSSSAPPHGDVSHWSTEEDIDGNQWRAPLRAALDWLASALDAAYQAEAGQLFRDPSAARADYGAAAYTNDPNVAQRFLNKHLARRPVPEEAIRALRLMEMNRWRLQAMSRWSFDGASVADTGPCYALAAAARALEILTALEHLPAPLPSGTAKPRRPPSSRAGELEKEFLARLAEIPGGKTAYENGAAVYQRIVKPGQVGPSRLAAHAAIAEHLQLHPETDPAPALDTAVRVLCRRAKRRGTAMATFSVVRVSVLMHRTCEHVQAVAAVLHDGGADVQCWLNISAASAGEAKLAGELDDAFLRGGPDALRRSASDLINPVHHGLDALLPAARRQVARQLLPRGLPERREWLRKWRYALSQWHTSELAEARVAGLLGDTQMVDTPADTLPGARLVRERMVDRAANFASRPSITELDRLTELLGAAHRRGLHLPLWELQELGLRGMLAMIPGRPPHEPLRRLSQLLGLSESLLGIADKPTEEKL